MTAAAGKENRALREEVERLKLKLEAKENELRAAKDEIKDVKAQLAAATPASQGLESSARAEGGGSSRDEEVATLKAQMAAAQAVSADACGPSGTKRRRTTEEGEEKKEVELPIGVWAKIAEKVGKNDMFSFAMTCKQLREAQQAAGRRLETITELWDESGTHVVDAGFTPSRCWFHTRSFNIDETRAECFKAVNMVAAYCGYLDVLKHWENVPEDKKKLLWDEKTCRMAARRGHLDVLKYLRGQGCHWDKWTCACAARGGHLEVLKWSRGQNPPWLKWRHDQGCPWDDWTCAYAAYGGHLEVLKWLRGQNPPWPWDKSLCLTQAQRNNHSHVVAWINSQP